MTEYPTCEDAATLLDHARDLLERRDAVGVGLWQRTAALLARQSLEIAVTQFWLFRVPGVAECSVRAQLLALPYYTSNDEIGPRATHAWRLLSRACHHRAYELAPTATELGRWLDSVEWLVEASCRRP